MVENIDWLEELPPKCPPADAVEPNNDLFYRLVGSVPPRDNDFWSHRKLYPSKKFNTTECVARSCSLIATIEYCLELLKLPAQHNKRIVKLILPSRAGLVKQTGLHIAHYSWWRTKDFDPINVCIEITS
jgi:hypothetical protein